MGVREGEGVGGEVQEICLILCCRHRTLSYKPDFLSPWVVQSPSNRNTAYLRNGPAWMS